MQMDILVLKILVMIILENTCYDYYDPKRGSGVADGMTGTNSEKCLSSIRPPNIQTMYFPTSPLAANSPHP